MDMMHAVNNAVLIFPRSFPCCRSVGTVGKPIWFKNEESLPSPSSSRSSYGWHTELCICLVVLQRQTLQLFYLSRNDLGSRAGLSEKYQRIHLRKFQLRVYSSGSHPHGLYQDGCCCFREKVSTHAIFSFRRLRTLITPQPVGTVGLSNLSFFDGRCHQAPERAQSDG